MSDEIIRVIFALIAIIGMIGVCALMAKQLGLAQHAKMGAQQRRLKIVESISIDARTRIAIVKCDDTEHLIAIGAGGTLSIANDLPAPNVTDLTDEQPNQEFGFSLAEDSPFAKLLQKLRERGETTAPPSPHPKSANDKDVA